MKGLIFFMLLIGLQSEYSHFKRVNYTQYYDSNKSEPHDKISIVMATGFEHSYLTCYLNDSLILEGNVNTKESTGFSDVNFELDIKNLTKLDTIRIFDYGEKTSLNFVVNMDYRYVHVHKRVESKWILSYREGIVESE